MGRMEEWMRPAALVSRSAGLFLLLSGCAPPDPIESTAAVPEIRLLFPDGSEPLELDGDGFLRTLVVVDLIGIDFVEPEGTDPVDGEGHYHLFVQETTYVEAPSALFFELESDAFTAGSRGIINVDLRQNDHSLLSEAVDECDCTAAVEFDVVDASE